MATEKSYGFVGTWEIVESHHDDTGEKLGLDGIKFRLDEMGDIIWYNDLINTSSTGWGTPFGSAFCPIIDSAEVLFSCETYELMDMPILGPLIIFGAYTGRHIEFKASHYSPRERMTLRAYGWCELHCQRVKDDQSVVQEEPFTLISVLHDGNFCDVTLKSCDNVIYNVHSPILRLNGFDCSSMTAASTYQHLASRFEFAEQAHTLAATHPSLAKMSSVPCARSSARTANGSPTGSLLGQAPTLSVSVNAMPGLHPSVPVSPTAHLNPNFLLPPTVDALHLSPKQMTNISTSFTCLTAAATSDGAGNSIFLDVPKRAGPHQFASCSDSSLNVDRNVFYFPDTVPVCRGVKFKQPSSPFRARSPSPFAATTLETPPSSPLTPLSVLSSIPSKVLTTILHWLYCECLPEQLDEETCIQLINMCENTPPLSRMIEPCKSYLRNIQLKKFVVDLTNDMHDSLNHLIQMVNPSTISHSPCVLCQVFKEGVKECLTVIVKLLQLGNIFTKDATTFTRSQRHEIIKYVRTHIPIYLSQVHKLLKNISLVLSSLTQEDRNDLVSYLVPEITGALEVLTASLSEVKLSLEKVCKDLNSTQQQQQQPPTDGAAHDPCSNSMPSCSSAGRSGQQPSDRSSERTPSSSARTRGAPEKQSRPGQSSTESDLKFFLYMYEVKKMRDIYGRVTYGLEVLLRKKSSFNEMNLLDQHQTVRRNLEQLAEEVSAAIGQLTQLCDTIDEKIGWKEFKFCFKFLASQVNGIISKLLEHKAALNDSMLYISNLVQKEQFTCALVELGLLDKRSVEPSLLHECAKRRCAVRSSGQRQHEYATVKVNLMQNLFEAPTAAHSNLSKNALKLLHSGQLADLEFEVVIALADSQDENVASTFDASPDDGLLLNGAGGRYDSRAGCSKSAVRTSSSGVTPPAGGTRGMDPGSNSMTGTGIAKGSQSHSFKAHRVIVAARCEWFKKALLSGMQEDIKRKIIIYDTSPVIFRRLLLYLYGAPVDKSVGVDQLCELMLLADRYSVDNLKAICEETLVASIDQSSVICLYGISDRFNADTLRDRCLSYLSEHNYLTGLDIFKQLPYNLQKEVKDLISWCDRAPEPWCDYIELMESRPYSRCSPRFEN